MIFWHLLQELGSGIHSIETAIKKTKFNIQWMKKYYKTIVDWLQKRNSEEA